jgi:hypothetical protein
VVLAEVVRVVPAPNASLPAASGLEAAGRLVSGPDSIGWEGGIVPGLRVSLAGRGGWFRDLGPVGGEGRLVRGPDSTCERVAAVSWYSAGRAMPWS